MLEVKNVNFDFGLKPVLRDISFECQPGRTVGIVGRSGAGKTTLLNLVAGMLDTQVGSILINGHPSVQAVRRGLVGYIFQTPTLMPWLTVRQNVHLALSVTSKAQRKRPIAPHMEVDEALRAARIDQAAEQLPSQLSGGMQTRAAIARALVYRPQVLLADEIFSGLDDVVKEALYAEFQEITAKRQMTTVLVSHNLTETLLLSDLIIVLSENHEGAGSSVRLREMIPFARPRTSEISADPAFVSARSRLLDALR